MRIVIIGGDSAGLLTALYLKKENPSFEITIIEKNQKLGKKLLATGNGKCNILNTNISPDSFNHPEFVKEVFPKGGYCSLKSALESIGLLIKEDNEYAYPISYSAKSVVDLIKTLISSYKINVRLEEVFIDYDDKVVLTDKGTYPYDHLVICAGGKSQKNLGSDGSVFEILNKHKYQITELLPGLCPVKVKERVKEISGQRHHCLLEVYDKENKIFVEEGEVLFKNDGLSGIVVFNASRVLRNEKGSSIKINLFPEFSRNELYELLEQSKIKLGENYLLSLLTNELANFLKGKNIDQTVENLTNLRFTYIENYSFDESQITMGGVDLSMVTTNLSSKIEPRVFFSGEVLDIDGPCGGYNLGWCLMSSLKVKEAIISSLKNARKTN